MNASKENAREALRRMEEPPSPVHDCFIRAFLEAAERKLPSEASYTKARTKTTSASKPNYMDSQHSD